MTKNNLIKVSFIFLVLSVFLIQACTTKPLTKAEEVLYMTIDGSHAAEWKLTATDPLLIGGYGDNFVYNGEKVQALTGNAIVDVNAETNTGKMVATFKGTITPEANKTYTGTIRLEYTMFKEGSDFLEGGIADFIYLHGDTGQEAPVMPKVKTPLASWGPVNVYVDDVLIYEKLVGHMMYTEASRNQETYAIYNSDKSGFYSPKDPSNGSIAHPDKMELHFVAHTVEPDTGNFPPHTVWIHLNYITVSE
ncbi:MAG: hypothetical protein OCD02_17590 [Spirochaetaceae bacterium]